MPQFTSAIGVTAVHSIKLYAVESYLKINAADWTELTTAGTSDEIVKVVIPVNLRDRSTTAKDRMETIGNYEYRSKDLIGHGAFAVVYRGRTRTVSFNSKLM